jgi:hypothetical protein
MRDPRRAGALALTGLAWLVVAGACNAATDGDAARPATACERLAGSVRDCGLLSDGDTGCGDSQTTELSGCFAECYEAAECMEIEYLFCRESLSASMQDCIEACKASTPQFTCDNGGTIPVDWTCDGDHDCNDSSDEIGCDEGPTFTCTDGPVHPADYECDGIVDCADETDESHCPEAASLLCPS